MKTLLLPPLLLCITLGSCSTLGDLAAPSKDSRALLAIPAQVDQALWYPKSGVATGYYASQSVLYAELGARFFELKDLERAREFFELAVKYDKRNEKAQFSLGILEYRSGRYEAARSRFEAVPPRDARRYPYDIDYYEAARMIIAAMSLEGKVISLGVNDRSLPTDGLIVVNRGRINGLQEGMRLAVHRNGNPIRDFDSLEVIGVQRTQIATVSVTTVDERSAVCKVEKTEPGYFVQINDILTGPLGGK